MTSDQTHTVTSPTITTTVTSSTPAGGGATRIRTATHTSVNSTSPLQPKAEPARMSEPLQQPVVLPDHAKQQDLGHGYGETTEQHMHHSDTAPTHHWGLPISSEERLFYALAIPSWCLNIVSGIIGSYFDTGTIAFIITVSLFQAFSWAAWWQTVAQMLQRASWTRDEGNLVDRRRFLHLAVRLNRLMWPTAIISFAVFVVAYVRRNDVNDTANWLLFQLIFIFNIVACVMNAYNNITWESDRLEFEEGTSPYGNLLLAILGIPTEPRKNIAGWHEE